MTILQTAPLPWLCGARDDRLPEPGVTCTGRTEPTLFALPSSKRLVLPPKDPDLSSFMSPSVELQLLPRGHHPPALLSMMEKKNPIIVAIKR